MLLEIDNITLLYGRIQALHGISLEVGQGEIVALIGANGAGKTTTMRAVSGLRPIGSGAIRFAGQDITRMRPDLRVARGISQSPEGRGIFPGMTVLENLEMGAYTRRHGAAIRQDLDRVFGLFPRLRERMRQAGGTLSGGEQQRSEEHTSELQSQSNLVCRLLLEKKIASTTLDPISLAKSNGADDSILPIFLPRPSF